MFRPILTVLALLIVGCAPLGRPPAAQVPADARPLDTSAIERVLGMRGTAQGVEYKVSIPQNDLAVRLDGFDLVPPMGMGSWVAFTPTPHGVMLMGDVVVLEPEIGPVQRAAIAAGLTVTGLHNHFAREAPKVMYMHVGGMGTEEALAGGVRAVLDEVARLRDGDPAAAEARTVPTSIDTARVAAITGHSGTMSRGVYRQTIGRPDVDAREHGVPVTSFAGFNTWAAWQGTPERTAVAGDFAMLADEVEPVIRTLIEHGIEVVAVHNHMVHEQPRIFFLHYWGVGEAERLAVGLRAALDQTGAPAGR